MRGSPGGLRAALGFFTVIPVRAFEADRGVARSALLAFPLVGTLMGAVAAAVAVGVRASGAGTPLAAVCGLAVLAALTGALHLDGLADTADGLGSRRGASEALEIMKRSDIGPMGVVALVFVLGLDAAALASPRLSGWALPAALVAAPAVARAAVLLGARRGVPAARPGGFGALFADALSPAALGVVLSLVLAGAGGLGWAASGLRGAAVFAGAAVVAWLAAAWLGRTLVRRLGGHTGDTFGALLEVGQVVFLVTVAVGT